MSLLKKWIFCTCIIFKSLLHWRFTHDVLGCSLLEDCAPGTCVPEFHSFFWSAGGFSILCKRICKGTGAQDKVSIPFALRHLGHLVNVTHVQKAIFNPEGLVGRVFYSVNHVHYVYIFASVKLFRENYTIR